RHDAWVVEPRRELDLALEPLALARGRFPPGEQDLERDRAPRRLLHRPVDDALAAAADLRLDAVPGHAIARRLRVRILRPRRPARRLELAQDRDLPRSLLDERAAARAAGEVIRARRVPSRDGFDPVVAEAPGHGL